MTLIAVPCDLCGGTSFDTVYAATISDPDADPAVYFSSSRLRAGYLTIVRCRGCRLMMTNPRDDDATLARVYAALADRVYAAEDDNRRLTAEEHLTLVTSYQPGKGRLLDVGCATGLFVCAAHEAGWQATGLDASAWAISRARKQCRGAAFVAGQLEAAVFPPESCNVVTLWDVLEHVRSPGETLSYVHRWLAPKGWLFLNLPNANSVTARLMGKRWVLLLREHLWYFSPVTLAILLRQSGFELVRTRPNFVRFSMTNIVGRLGQYGGGLSALSRRLGGSARLRRLTIRFPMGEMTVVARKADG